MVQSVYRESLNQHLWYASRIHFTFEMVKFAMPDRVSAFWFMFCLEQREKKGSRGTSAFCKKAKVYLST